jgi:HK97 family phage portal protein
VFPAIREAWRDFKAGFGSEPISIKDAGLTFDAFNADWYSRNGYNGIYAALSGGAPAWSGEVVSQDKALNHSVVWACNRIISESVSFLPLSLMQETSKGKFPAVDHPTYQAIQYSPNPEITSMCFRETLTSHCVLGGNAYAQIIRRSGTGQALEFRPLMPSQIVQIARDNKQQLVYVVKDGNSADKDFTIVSDQPQPILHVRGIGNDFIRGYSVLTMARQSIGTALAGEKFAGKFWANGGRVPYVLNLEKQFRSDADFDKFRSDWETTYRDPHKAPMLEPWVKYQQVGMNLRDCQLLESRQFSIPEICRWFQISPHMVADLSRATFSNVENLAQQFVTFTLMSWIKRWEQELRRCVLTPEEKGQGYFFHHNTNALLRGDFLSRTAGYASALQNGYLNQDEVRDLEDRNPIPGGEGQFYRVQLNMQTLTKDPAAAQLEAQRAAEPKAPAAPLETIQ